ncbi:sulfotransferase family 2 domain-containing protein [uncultured Marixanthomonas sp.]|uniref:sulfotransferase family 2 domain-containing protein n=1 Tax=uncultured Marixanthomonas sp. TaxID=757245 RepID=UPI0030D9B038|tara:strand:- start:58765 stop:59445 length:681 start_codon:yes stop_codon:yes gene_type:complete
MISHEHKCIFIHIPKTAGTSINEFFHPGVKFKVATPDYERLFGWCPKRRLHMQHATSKQLLETELITEEQWNAYFKFTFVRNPWDRAYSDYLWIQSYAGVKGSFNDYLNRTNEFSRILNDNSNYDYLGDHLLNQTDFFDFEGKYKLDFIGRFENFDADIALILKQLSIKEKFELHKNKSERHLHYSNFYTKSRMKKVKNIYERDISLLEYSFEDERKGFKTLKRFI